ncbi:MAG: MarR family transcriptional regulator [Acidimicrobiales bacterium]
MRSHSIVASAADPNHDDVDQAETASRLRLAVTRLHRRLRQQTPGDLSPSQASALASVEQLGSPTLGELALRESVQPPSLTPIIAALEERSLVSREADPGDRRVTRVTATPAGRAVLDQRRSVRDAYLLQRLQVLAPDERAALGALATLLERLAEGEEP